MPIKTLREKKSVFIEVTGDLGVEQSGELYDALKKALSGKETSISIDLSGVTELDIASLQLICSAHKSAARSGVSLKISRIDSEIMKVAADAGFLGQSDCSSEMSDSCPWNIKGEAA